MQTAILLKFWKEILLVVFLSSGFYFVYNKVYTKGYTDATTYYTKIIYDNSIHYEKKLKEVELLSTKLTAQNKTDMLALKQDLDKLLLETKDKPSASIINGKCVPSKIFISTYNKIITKAQTEKRHTND